MQRLVVRVALSQIARLVGLVGLKPVGQEADRIAVPACNIEIRADVEMIELQLAAHVVVDQRLVSQRTQRINLHLVECNNLVRGIASEIKHMRRVGLGYCQVGQADLIEGVIVHGPEDIAPCAVQRIG